jgi:hypothetical protein
MNKTSDKIEKLIDDETSVSGTGESKLKMDIYFEKMGSLKEERGLPFGEALNLLKYGYKLQREGWNGKGMYISFEEIYSADGRPFNRIGKQLLISLADGAIGMWNPTQTDLLAEDWVVL